VATELGLVQRTGAWYAIGENRLGQGREAAREALEQSPEVAAQLAQKVWELVRGGKRPPVAGTPAAEAEE